MLYNDVYAIHTSLSLYRSLFVFECLASVDSVGEKNVEC